LHPLIPRDEIAHGDRGADLAWQPTGGPTKRRRNRADDPCKRPRESAPLEFTGCALGWLAHPIAEVLPPPHHGAALANPAEASGVGGHNHTGTRGLRGPKLRQSQAGDEGVHVNDFGSLNREPCVEQFGAPDSDLSLTFGACGLGGDRVAIHRYPVMFIHALAIVCGIRSGHEHLMTFGAQAAA
jgi:hypothetical protein